MKRTLVFVDDKQKKGVTGKYEWVLVKIDGIECWKTTEQLREMKHEVKIRSARQ